MPSFDQANLIDNLQRLVTIGTLIIGSVAIVYSLIFVGGRVLIPRKMRARLITAIVAALLVVVLAALDIFLAVAPS